MVNDRELYDLPADPGEEHNVLHEHPSIVAELRREYDKWWNDVTPLLVNEAAAIPEANAYRTLYDEQVARSGVDELDLDVKQWPSAALP